MQRVTVFEVAAAAGVSLATVDRVLNGRKGVRPKTIERVQAAVAALGFERDPFAAGLATRRQERFLFVLPQQGSNSFMNGLRDTVSRTENSLRNQRVSVVVADYESFNEASLCRTLAVIDPARCDGVALVAIDSPRVRHAVDRLVLSGVPVTTLISDVTPSRRSRFIGIDNKAAGRLAASLIGRMARRDSGRIAIVVGRMTLHDHADRRLGFEQVMTRDFPGFTILPVLEGRDDGAVTERLAGRLLKRHPDLVGLYSAGAGNRGVIAALRAAAIDDNRPIVVAHELTAHARDALMDDTFTVVLHQDQEQEVSAAIAALRALKGGDGVDAGDAPPPIRTQIFLRDNVP